MSNSCPNPIYSTPLNRKTSIALLPLLGTFLPVASASAQVIATEGTTTQVEVNGDRIDITGGEHSRDQANLFQSFQQFDLASEQTASFVTTANVQNVIGSVQSQQASTINGSLQVTGSDANLYLVNPAGILMGPDSHLNLSGGFTATTATRIGFDDGQLSSAAPSDYAELTGDPTTFYFDTSSPGAVVNHGELSVQTGESIQLIGGTVVSDGQLTASAGTITLAAVEGENLVRLGHSGQLLSFEIEPLKIETSASGGAIGRATDSAIAPTSLGEMLTGSSPSPANNLAIAPDGTIRLVGEDRAISESGGQVILSDRLSTEGLLEGLEGGDINVLGEHILLTEARLDASGMSGGGQIRVGGDYQGEGEIATALTTTIDTASSLIADALQTGDGGDIVAWSDQQTIFEGSLSALGGSSGGDGGFAEVSGKTHLTFSGSANLSAPAGQLGQLLLDPENIVITDGSAPANTITTDYRSSASIENILGNLEITATNDITIEDLSDNELLFSPGTHVTFRADADNDGSGQFSMEAEDAITARTGRISIFGAGLNVGKLHTDSSSGPGGDITLLSSQGVTTGSISTNSFSFGNNAGNGGNLLIEANNGSISVDGLIKTWSYTQRNNSGAGGSVTLEATGDIAVAQAINSLAATDGNNAGAGGSISLISTTGNIATDELTSFSRSRGNNANLGGSIFVSAPNGQVSFPRIDSASRATNRNASDGGNVSIEADIINIGSINTASISLGNGSTAQAGTVDLNAQTALNIERINAASSGENSLANSILLSANTIDINGGANSITGSSVGLSTADLSRDINLGYGNADSQDPFDLNITENELQAIHSILQPISISAGNSTGTIGLFPGAIAHSNPIDILGGDTLAINDETVTVLFDSLDSGRLGNHITFANIEQFSGIDTASYEHYSGPSLLIDLNNFTQAQNLIGSNNSTLKGADTDNIWVVDGENRGSVGSVQFENFQSLVGGSARDDFRMRPGSAITGMINGSSGTDTLDYSNYGSDLTIEFDTGGSAEGTTNNITGFSSIETVIGNSAAGSTLQDTLIGSHEADSFTILGIQSGEILVGGNSQSATVSFSQIETLEGQAGADRFEINAPTAALGISIEGDGREVADTPVENRISTNIADLQWILTGENQGSLEHNGTVLTTFKEIIPPDFDTSEIEEQNPTEPTTLLADLIAGTTVRASEAAENTSISQLLTNLSASDGQVAPAAVIRQIETNVSASFNAYLGLGEQADNKPATLDEMQTTLGAIAQSSDVSPAVIYAYFVPDAASEDAIVTGSNYPTRPDDQLEIMVVTQENDIVRQRAWGITRAQVENTSQRFLQHTTSQFSTERQYLPPAQQLYSWLIRPIEQRLERHHIDSIGFVLDTGLRTLPLAALHDGDRYLAESYSIGLLPTFSLTDFDTRLSEERTDFTTAQVLAMGASQFENQHNLPAVDAEVNLITNGPWEGEAFLNEDFVLDNLEMQLQQNTYGVLHLATHAVFEAGSIEDSYIQLWNEKLSLNEVANLQLSNSNLGLIILSACSTALGDEASEYGFAGFAVKAGSQSALASLWPVNDEGTLGFMSQFYGALRTTSTRAEALQQAQLSLISGEVGIADGTIYGQGNEEIASIPALAESGRWTFAHPFYWSAFTMIGNPW
ncbi:MAG: CHAT domain-containing protein [Cyanobacteria bacterium J06627_32]